MDGLAVVVITILLAEVAYCSSRILHELKELRRQLLHELKELQREVKDGVEQVKELRDQLADKESGFQTWGSCYKPKD